MSTFSVSFARVRRADCRARTAKCQRRQRHQVVVVAQLAFHLLDLLAPDGQLLLGGEQIFDLPLAVLDDVEQPILHRAGGAQLARGVGVLLGDILRREILALEVAERAEFHHQRVEMIRRNAHDDHALHFSVRQLL